MHDDSRWLDLLVRDAPVHEFSALGAELSGRGLAGARAAATALELRSLLQQRAQRAGELGALNDIACRLSALHSPEDLLPEVVDQARRLLRVDLAYLGLIEQEPRLTMRVAVANGARTPELIGLPVRLSSSLAGQVVEHAAPRWVSDYQTSETFQHDETADAAAVSENMRALLGVPLKVRGQVIGALFACKRSERHFTEDEVALLSGLAAHAAIAIDNARSVARLASAHDELTRRTTELERAVAWNERLTQLVLRGGGVEDLLTEITAATTNPVRFVRDDQRGSVTETAAADGRREWIMREVAAGDHDFGCLVMSSATEPSPEDLLVVDQAAPVLALALVAEEAVAEAGRYARDSLLAELLTTPSTDPATTRKLARRAGLDPSTRYLVVVAETPTPLAHRKIVALAWPPGTRTAMCQGRLVVLTPADDPVAVHRLWEAEGLPTAGAAGPVEPGGGLHACHQEAMETLEALTALGLTGTVRTADQLGLYRVLLNHAGRREIEAAFDRTLAAVAAEEDRRGVPLLETIRCFLAEGRRPRSAARALGIHVNTLYQRLATIDRLLGDQWQAPDQALELQLVLRMRQAAAAFE